MHDNCVWNQIRFPDFVRDYKAVLMEMSDIDAFSKSAERAFGLISSSVESIVSLFRSSPMQIFHPENSPSAPFLCVKVLKMPENIPVGFSVLGGNRFDLSCEIILHFIDAKYSGFATGKLSMKITEFIDKYISECGFEYCSTHLDYGRRSLIRMFSSLGFEERAYIPEFLHVRDSKGSRRVGATFMDKTYRR